MNVIKKDSIKISRETDENEKFSISKSEAPKISGIDIKNENFILSLIHI